MALALRAIGIEGGYAPAAFTPLMLPIIASSTSDSSPTRELEAKSHRPLRRSEPALGIEKETERQLVDFIGLGK